MEIQADANNLTKAVAVDPQWSKATFSVADKKRIQASFAALQQMFKPDEPMPIESQKLYFAALQDLGVERIERACMMALQKCKWFPKPVELRELVREPADDPEYRAGEAWKLALRYGVTSRRALDFQDSIINAVIGRLGGLDVFAEFGSIEAERFVKPRFIAEYLRLAAYEELPASQVAPLRCRITNQPEPCRIGCEYVTTTNAPRIANAPTSEVAGLVEALSIKRIGD